MIPRYVTLSEGVHPESCRGFEIRADKPLWDTTWKLVAMSCRSHVILQLEAKEGSALVVETKSYRKRPPLCKIARVFTPTRAELNHEVNIARSAGSHEPAVSWSWTAEQTTWLRACTAC